MTTNAAVDVRSLFSEKLASIFEKNVPEMKKLQTQLQTQLQNYGTNPVKSWTKLFSDCIRAITYSSNPIERINEYKPKFVAELQLKYPNIDVLNNKTKNEFVVLFAETLSTILLTEPPVEPVVEQKESVPVVETDEEKEVREIQRNKVLEENKIIQNNNAAIDERERELASGPYGVFRGVGGSLPKKTPRRRKYSKRNNTRRKRTARKRRSYK